MEYTIWTVQNQGDATTERKISRATGIIKKDPDKLHRVTEHQIFILFLKMIVTQNKSLF